MNQDKYSDRSLGFIQSAQALAVREGHQQFAPEHLLKVLLDDEEGFASGLVDRASGKSRQGREGGEATPGRRPSVSGGGAGHLSDDPAPARSCERDQQ